MGAAVCGAGGGHIIKSIEQKRQGMEIVRDASGKAFVTSIFLLLHMQTTPSKEALLAHKALKGTSKSLCPMRHSTVSTTTTASALASFSSSPSSHAPAKSPFADATDT